MYSCTNPLHADKIVSRERERMESLLSDGLRSKTILMHQLKRTLHNDTLSLENKVSQLLDPGSTVWLEAGALGDISLGKCQSCTFLIGSSTRIMLRLV